MGILNRAKQAWNVLTRPAVDLDDEMLLEWLGIDKKKKTALSEVTYFTCLKMLSETMGKMPLKFYQRTGQGKIRADPNRAAHLLQNRPNRIMTPATFWATVEFNCEHYGNAFAWKQTRFIKNKFGGEYQVQSFWPMQSNQVEVVMDDAGAFGEAGYLYYRYTDPKTGKAYVFRQDNVLHFKTWCTLDGVMGKSVRDILRDTVDGASESQEYLNNLYAQGMTASMAMQYTGDMSRENRKAFQKEYNDMFTGVKNTGKVVAVPVGVTLQPLNIKLTDAQFFELKKYSALQIAAAFGIKPNQINNYEKSSYANSETQQLAFLVDTMAYRLAQYEQEINYKCLTPEEIKAGYYFKFNEKSILRTDSKTQRENIIGYVTNGIYQINEGRDLLDMPYVEGGDVNMVNGTYQPITKIGAAYDVELQEGGEGNED
jgi:HK97 family phage portal protein